MKYATTPTVIVDVSRPGKWAPFIDVGLTLIPAWISNHMSYTMWDEITYSFPTVAQLEFGNGSVISSHTL